MTDTTQSRTRSEPPDGFTEKWDSNTWNVGFVFRWSDVFETWLDCCVILTIKPNQTLPDAFETRMNEPMWDDYDIFFAERYTQ